MVKAEVSHAIALSDLEMHTDKRIWQYFTTHYADWFPGLASRSAFVRQCANLLPVKQRLLSEIYETLRTRC